MKPGPSGLMATSPFRATLAAPALPSTSVGMTTGVSLMRHARFPYTQKGLIGKYTAEVSLRYYVNSNHDSRVNHGIMYIASSVLTLLVV